MKTQTLLVSAAAVHCVSVALSAAGIAEARIEEGLQAEYLPGKTVLAVQRPGINVISGEKVVAFANEYKDGRIHHAMLHSLVSNVTGKRELEVGEKVLVVKIDVKDAAVVFHLLSCGSCDIAALRDIGIPHRASLSYYFGKGFRDSMTWNEVHKIISEVLASPEVTSIAVQPVAPLPAPVVPAPPRIELDQTVEQVWALLGPPEKVVALPNKAIHVYHEIKVTFINGRVVDVQ